MRELSKTTENEKKRKKHLLGIHLRCDVDSLVSETLLAERGYGSKEKHFPPMQQSDVLSSPTTTPHMSLVLKRALRVHLIRQTHLVLKHQSLKALH